MWRTDEWIRRWRGVSWWVWAGLAGFALVLVIWLWPEPGNDQTAVTFAVSRGPLAINVIEGGSIEALESQDIKCEVRGSYQGVKILKIVDEGYQVTPEDVLTNKVLVELDSSEIEKELVEQEIRYQSAAASLAEAEQGFEIQLVQNLSDVKAAEQKARFARMDFEKFLGEEAAEGILADLGLSDVLESLTNIVVTSPLEVGSAEAVVLAGDSTALTVDPAKVSAGETPLPGASGAAAGEGGVVSGAEIDADAVVREVAGLDGGVPATPAPPSSSPPSGAASVLADLPPALLQAVAIDFSEYADLDRLGDGEAKQKVRKFQDDLMVALRELEQARSQQEGTRRLFDQGFVTRIDMERDDLSLTNSLLKVQTAETAQELFLK